MPDKAIGLINSAVTGEHRARDEQLIAQLIRSRGYESAGLLTVDENTYMPTTLIVHTASQVGATAIVAPGLDHFGAATRAVALACMLVTPTRTISRRGADA
ncbi:hypothetical protein OG874_00670 [Nocardia sp. NBC_00565]|uniref:hypothetical protein n=1 Tax=Nocardia sp. NBC_00565 TaxID=2975993 RepID=UPI002E811066|nr:hypothetical protein [Nocardia sp. NBC_00565]WUC03769.1 hypothetical protein OG874_00670 [Nocardia sp. NBC_00565]